jgi:hypothetical protein
MTSWFPAKWGPTYALVAVDDVDYPRVSRSSWFVTGRGNYVYATIGGRRVSLHQFVCGSLPAGQVWDHANGDQFDNRRSNLRPATVSQNAANSSRRSRTSQFKGVTRKGSWWVAQLTVNGTTTRLGQFVHEEDAATAYNLAAWLAFGDFARLNDCDMLPSV